MHGHVSHPPKPYITICNPPVVDPFHTSSWQAPASCSCWTQQLAVDSALFSCVSTGTVWSALAPGCPECYSLSGLPGVSALCSACRLNRVSGPMMNDPKLRGKCPCNRVCPHCPTMRRCFCYPKHPGGTWCLVVFGGTRQQLSPGRHTGICHHNFSQPHSPSVSVASSSCTSPPPRPHHHLVTCLSALIHQWLG